ncbi:MAG: hypothetical protein NVSMB25_20830 [Thermoleophilaceae bacterium]
MRGKRRQAQDLRRAVDCLPVRTRAAMLDGISSNEIIVGAYSDRDGGVCPMLAAHRHGGRTALASFARAWDRYTDARGGPRRASPRELRTLSAMLEASMMFESGQVDLAAAARAHRAARAQPAPAPVPRDTGERDRSGELRSKPGWAWLRIFRRYDDYAEAVAAAERAERTSTEEFTGVN